MFTAMESFLITSQLLMVSQFPSMLQLMAHSHPQLHEIASNCVERDPTRRPIMSNIVEQLNTMTK